MYLTLMTNVTEIVEQDLERKRLANAIENVPLIIQYWDENDKLIFANAKADELIMNNGKLIVSLLRD